MSTPREMAERIRSRMRPFNVLPYVITTILCTLRIAGYTSPTYQALAHLYVGSLIGAASGAESARPLRFAAVLILVEAVMFVLK